MKTVSPGERIERNLDVRGAPQHERFEQVSRLENAAHAVTVSTLIRVFDALDATLLFRVELDGKARALTLP